MLRRSCIFNAKISKIALPSFDERVKAIEKDWAESPRWANVTRPYSAEQVVSLQGTFPANPNNYSKFSSEKAFDMFTEFTETKDGAVTFGALDPVQVVQMAKYARAIYVSGWQCAATYTSTRETGPDVADYPYDTVPKKVDELVRALRFHDKKQFAKNGGKAGPVDYFPPIIADADAGHGGMTAVMKLARLFIEAGAAGIHIEDQRAGAKKCGHMGGKVLVSIQEEIDRLCAARLESDVQGASLLLVARTDSEAGSLIDSNADARDHPFIKGSVVGGNSLFKEDELVTFGDAVTRVLQNSKDDKALAEWAEKYPTMGYDQSKELATQLTNGSAPEWNWDMPRTREGFYQYKNGTDAAIARSKAFAPYGDIAWMETAKPGVEQATKFSNAMLGCGSFLAYNLSPSFNWDAAGMSDEQISSFCKDLAGLGFVFQFITLAGFHGSGLIADQVARDLMRQKDMLAYVNKIQRVERAEGVELLTHQQWAGASYIDQCVETIRGAADDIGINAAGNTEAQFGVKPIGSK